MQTVNFCVSSEYTESMEMLALLFLYLLSQNHDFSQKIQSLCKELKNSEELLRFIKDLSCFSDLFPKKKQEKEPEPTKKEQKEPPVNPTSGIADEFIEKFFNDYLKNKN